MAKTIQKGGIEKKDKFVDLQVSKIKTVTIQKSINNQDINCPE
jgi:hypothetical protein